jgi:hypothetical protein
MKTCLPKKQMMAKKQSKSYSNLPKPQKACNVLNLSDKVKVLDLVKGSMSLVEAGQYYGEK